MSIFAQQDPPLGFVTLVFLAIGACLVAWAAIAERLVSGAAVLPYQPRRRIPWRFWDLLVIVLFQFAGANAFFVLVQYFLSPENLNSAASNTAGQISKDHPLVQLLLAGDWMALVVGGIVGIVVAPITEEMFFRVLLQGWLEKIERKLRWRVPIIRRMMPLATIPILFSSLLFASVHFREAGPTADVRKLLWLFMAHGVSSLLCLFFGVLWVHFRRGATAEDLGWAPKKFLSDVRLGVISFAAIAVPIFCINIGLVKLLPEKYAPDPISIFFFAIALGLLYNRTHRAMPSIAAHMALNATSLAMVFLGSLG